MSLAVAALLIAQTAAVGATASTPVAQQAVATVRVLRPVRITVEGEKVEVKAGGQQASAPQRSRDSAGTVWIEFS